MPTSIPGPSGVKSAVERRFERRRVGCGADLPDAGHGDALPVEAGGAVAWIEEADDAVEAREGGEVVDLTRA